MVDSKKIRHARRDHARAPRSAQAGVESMETGMRLLLAFVALGGQGQMLKVLAAAAHMPSSKAHRYLVSLIRMGFVDRDPATGHYRLGPAAIRVGVSALGSIDAVALSVEVMAKLRDELDHTMALTVWSGSAPVIVRVEEGERLMTVGFRVGKSLPLLASAAGRMFASFLPAALAEPVMLKEIRANQRQPHGRLVASREDAERLLAEVRARGLARIEGDITPGISAMAAPVFDYRGHLATVITAIGPRGGFDPRWNGPVATALRRHTASLSERLGFVGGREAPVGSVAAPVAHRV